MEGFRKDLSVFQSFVQIEFNVQKLQDIERALKQEKPQKHATQIKAFKRWN